MHRAWPEGRSSSRQMGVFDWNAVLRWEERPGGDGSPSARATRSLPRRSGRRSRTGAASDPTAARIQRAAEEAASSMSPADPRARQTPGRMSAEVMLPVSVRLLSRTGVRPIVLRLLVHSAEKLSPPFDAAPPESCFHTTLSVVFVTPLRYALTPTWTSPGKIVHWPDEVRGNHKEQCRKHTATKTDAVGNLRRFPSMPPGGSGPIIPSAR